jgi:hypothetical protein
MILNCPLLPKVKKCHQDRQKSLKVLEVEKVRKKMIEARRAHDYQTLEQFFSDDYTCISWKGKILGKSEKMAMFRSGQIKFPYGKEKDVKISIHECAAIVTGIVIKDRKKLPRLTKRFTEIFILEDGKWIKVARQATRLE